jgi:hypothetical protein
MIWSMSQLERALRDFDSADIAVPDLHAAAMQDPTALGDQVLGILTDHENSDRDETELRGRLAHLVNRGR